MYTTKKRATTSKARKTAAIKKARASQRAKSGFSIGVPGLFNAGAYWRKGRAGGALSRYSRPVGKASALMSRNMRYGQSFNTGAISMGMDDGIVRVKHREFLGVISSSTAFTTQRFELNPGLDRLMPWGSAIARNFQQYTIKSMAFEFISTSATALVSGTNTALGQISIATQYDALNPEFRNLSDLLNSQWSTSTKVSSDLVHPIETERIQTTAMPLYVRSGRQVGDLRLYDHGATTFAVYGCQSTGDVLGQIFVSYECEFYKPISLGVDGNNAESAFYTFYPNTAATGDLISPERPLGSAYFADMDNIGLNVGVAPNNTFIELPAGSSAYYLLCLAYFGSPPAVNLLRAGTFTFVNCQLEQNMWNQSPYALNLPVNEPYAGDGIVVGSNSQCPNFTYIINVIDPAQPARLTFNNNWQIVRQAGSNIRDTVNVVISQLNIGFQNFALPNQKVDNSGCCDDLQAQITALQELVAQLQAEEEESDEESDREHEEINERISRNEKVAVVAFKDLQHQIDKCCEHDKESDKEHKLENLVKNAKEEEIVALKARLEELALM